MSELGPFVQRVALTVVVVVLLFAAGARFTVSPVPTDGPQVPLESTSPHGLVSVSRVGEPIRVALTQQAVREVSLRIEGGCRIVPLAGEIEPLVLTESLSERTVKSGGKGIELGVACIPGEGIEIIPDQSPALWIDGRKYRGTIRLHVASDGRLRLVNVLPLEDYVAAVVDSEMPASFPRAAREAQAIVARTYAVVSQQTPLHRWFDLYASTASQAYLGYVYHASDGRLLAGETAAGRLAAAASKGMVCTDHGFLFRTYYSACCGGSTASGAAVFGDSTPALCGGVECRGCVDAPLFRWTRTAGQGNSFDRLLRRVEARLPAFGRIESVTTQERSDAPGEVLVSDGHRTVKLDAAEVKTALALPSLFYDLTGDATQLVAHGRGHGHGVGLCQWGARGLAEEGLSAEAILQHYYPGCTLARLP